MWELLQKSEESRISLFVGTLTNPFCKEVTGDCGTYYRNRIQSEFIGIFGYSKFFQVGIPTPFYRAFYFLLLLAVIYLVYPYFLKSNLLLQNLGWKGVGTPALILSLFVVTSLPGCGVLPGTGGKDGDPPWVLAMGANVNPGVPSIQNPGVGMTGGGSVGGVPVTGMFFFHPDHLGSITMITDGAGNPASGPEPGTSFVSYEPYGSIIRNDSYGPDIFRYKFTGQIEDKETGLYFYKARYYEPILGRFIQADSQVMPTNVNGMNRYMYVDGNPVNYRDVSGHVSGSGLMHMVNRIIGHAMGKDFHNGNSPSFSSIGKDFHRNALSKGINKSLKKMDTFLGKTDVGRFINKGWRDIRRSDLGTGFDKYIGKDGILGYTGDHLVTAPLKNMIEGKAREEITKKSKKDAIVNLYFAAVTSYLCGKPLDINFALKAYTQSKMLSPILSKYVADHKSHDFFPGQSSSYTMLNMVAGSGMLNRIQEGIAEANCQ
ncbi:RHS repeat-associated core domain protein [Leptospira noguchii str. 2001034031]|uniref:RHS repeat-associated core domain protein n=1 Tax=Leptospira noguchii str. 2001034031 TaxID=1193053 RepID=M6YVM4_9LEPT|nr:RHS repeat-associated core domain protein [Leptospira noguchii str. 2001034031]